MENTYYDLRFTISDWGLLNAGKALLSRRLFIREDHDLNTPAQDDPLGRELGGWLRQRFRVYDFAFRYTERASFIDLFIQIISVNSLN